MWSNAQFPADLVTFTEEILNGKLHFLCSAYIHIAIAWFSVEILLVEFKQSNDDYRKT